MACSLWTEGSELPMVIFGLKDAVKRKPGQLVWAHDLYFSSHGDATNSILILSMFLVDDVT